MHFSPHSPTKEEGENKLSFFLFVHVFAHKYNNDDLHKLVSNPCNEKVWAMEKVRLNTDHYSEMFPTSTE